MFLGTPWEGVTAGAMLGAGLILAIGAQNAFVLRQGLRREHVLLVVLTCLMGDIICISAGVAGVGGFIVSHPSFLAIATWGGALFLLYYGGLAASCAGSTACGNDGRKNARDECFPHRACLHFLKSTCLSRYSSATRQSLHAVW